MYAGFDEDLQGHHAAPPESQITMPPHTTDQPEDVMKNAWILVAAFVALLPAMAQGQDAKTVVANASKAMGADGLNSIKIYGSGANFGLGQSNNANGEWPRTNLNDYSRAI